MKTLNLTNLILVAFLILASAALVSAQGLQDKQPKNGFRPQEILRELNLTKEQIQQIRQIHEARREQMQTAQMRLRDANRNLDQAIYADTINEEEIQTRLKEAQAAQAEVIKLRNMTEFAVRKVLNPEQLARFRELREQFIKRMEEQRMNDEDIAPQERDDMQNPPVNNRPFQQRPKNRIN
ncbi:MAG TPA: periplasmic heavy metal sensor [Pyrinomonadaceae bacterium]|jgi:Spy/CpxP family protein refolding chaperone